jgi:CheY-like chemotaxis protein
MLERSGAHVRLAASAAEGWKALHDQTPDVVVADLAMPEEDGFSFMRRVRGDSNGAARVPAIALSAFADARSEAFARAAGFSAFLAKPTRPDMLLGLIDRLLHAPEGVKPSGPAAS